MPCPRVLPRARCCRSAAATVEQAHYSSFVLLRSPLHASCCLCNSSAGAWPEDGRCIQMLDLMRLRKARTAALLITGLMMGSLFFTPAGAHVGNRVRHLWTQHIRPKADHRYVRRTAQPGQTLSGQLTERYAPNAGFALTGDTYRVPLPEGTPAPDLEYRPNGTTSVTCPGIGRSSPGTLCVYDYQSNNIDCVAASGGFNGVNRRYGFSLDVFPITGSDGGYLLANWAYKVP